jgi:hypothetical protein
LVPGGDEANPRIAVKPERGARDGNFPGGAVLGAYMDPHEGRPATTIRAEDRQGFEAVALPWLDAVYRFARSRMTRPTRTT